MFIPVAGWSKVGVCRRSLAGFTGSILPSPPWHGCLCLVSVVCCQVEVSATGRSHDQRSHTGVVCLGVIVKA